MSSRYRRFLLLALAALAVVPAMMAAAGGPVIVEVPGRTNEYGTLASDGDFVVLTWAASLAGSGTDIYAAVSRDAAVSFSAPVRVNSTAGEAQVNGEQPPRVAIAPRGRTSRDIVIAWTAKGASGTRLLTARLRQATARLYERAALSSVGRVHAELLRQARLGAGLAITPAPVLADLALIAATTRETASRAVNALERRGIIRRDGDALVVVAPHRLEEMIL